MALPTGRPTNATMSGADAVAPDVVRGATHNARGDRKAAKGRRRRAAAEQRRIEQQRWGKYLDEDDEEEFAVVAPIPPGSRRRARRRNDRNVSVIEEDEPDPDLALALALALSLSSVAEDHSAPALQIDSSLQIPTLHDLSYESLVQLENVACVAPASVVGALPVCAFVAASHASVSEVCVICQGDYEHGDLQVKLPCVHDFHQGCGSEWLLKYSKLCPVCKHDVTDIASEASV